MVITEKGDLVNNLREIWRIRRFETTDAFFSFKSQFNPFRRPPQMSDVKCHELQTKSYNNISAK